MEKTKKAKSVTTSLATGNDLLPCPFCNSRAIFVEWDTGDKYRTESDYMVRCTGPKQHQLDMVSNKRDLLNTWNEKPLGVVLTYELVHVPGVYGQQIGADGTGTYCKLIYGAVDKADEYARTFLNDAERRGCRFRNISIVRNEELYTGEAIEKVNL